MGKMLGTEDIKNPLSESGLSIKGLADYVVNGATGCLHGCTFCLVPGTPMVSTHKSRLARQGIKDPMQNWGDYLLVRKDLPARLEARLSGMRSWRTTPAGKGVVMLSIGTDPFQNLEMATITREAIAILLRYGKRVRVLTRGLNWLDHVDLLRHRNVTVGMSISSLNDDLIRAVEPGAPRPSDRLAALRKGKDAGCRIFVSMSPTLPPIAQPDAEVCQTFQVLAELEPEVIFWEAINHRGTNLQRMREAGLSWVDEVSRRDQWAANFLHQWDLLESLKSPLLHVWPDAALKHYTDMQRLESWWDRPSREDWSN